MLSFRPRRLVIDGIPVYAGDASGPHSTIMILFRVGLVDENLGSRGMTHVVEHLALHGLRNVRYGFNGAVGFHRTMFTASGSSEELVDFTRTLCHNLRHLPLGELQRELGVLASESQGRAPSLEGNLMSIHCGYTPYGLINMAEFGLMRLRSDDIAHWAASCFTRDNAVVWVSGPVPDGLAFDLPAGARRPVPEPVFVSTLKPPVCMTRPLEGVALSAITQPTDALTLATIVCGRRLTERLRFKEGVSYNPFARLNHVTAAAAHLMMVADCGPGAVEQVARMMVETVMDVAANGHLESEIAPIIDGIERSCAAPDALFSTLNEWADRELTGGEQRTLAETIALLTAMAPRDVSAAMARALDGGVLVVPEGCPSPHPKFQQAKPHTSTAVRGNTFWKERRAWFNFGPRYPSITIGRDGVTHVNDRGEATTVYFNQCAGLLKYAEGRLVLLGEDCQSIEFLTPEWPDGSEIASLLDAALPDDRIIRCSW